MKRLFSIFFILILIISCSNGSNDGYNPNNPELEYDFLSDAEYIVNIVEDVHPAFTLREITDRYYLVRDEFLDKAADTRLTQTDFLLATQKYLAILQDGHMGLGLISSSHFIAADFTSREGKLYYNSNEILRIGDVPIDEIKAVVREYYFAENQVGWDLFYAVYVRQWEILRMAGVTFSGSNRITVVTTAGTSTLGNRAVQFTCG